MREPGSPTIRDLDENWENEQMIRLLNDVLKRQDQSDGEMQAVTIDGRAKTVEWEVNLDNDTRQYVIRMSDNNGHNIFINVSADGDAGSVTNMFGNTEFFKDLIPPEADFWKPKRIIDLKQKLSRGSEVNMDTSAEQFAMNSLAGQTIQMLLLQMDAAPEEELAEASVVKDMRGRILGVEQEPGGPQIISVDFRHGQDSSEEATG